MVNTVSIDRLPAPTWNRLRVNDASVAWDAENTVPLEDMRLTVAPGEKHPPVRFELADRGDAYSSGRLHLAAAAGSKVTVFERCTVVQNLLGQVEVTVGENATVRLVQLLCPEQGAVLRHEVRVQCGQKGQFQMITVLLGTGDVYADQQAQLLGDGSGFTADMAYLAAGTRRVDINLAVDHFGRDTTSVIQADGALLDGAQKTFRGTIDFKRGSSGAVGSENETVLLLGDRVVNKTVPLILCAEENVDGSHGATIGELDEDTRFYFESRGIDREKAESMLARAAVERLIRLTGDNAFAQAAEGKLEETLSEREEKRHEGL